MVSSRTQVAIIGGGVIGCSIAYQMAGAGFSVTVVEQGKIGGGASHVAAGMIASLSEGMPPGPPLDAALQSQTMLLEILPQLQEESGVDVEYRSPGILHLAITPEDEEELKARLEWQEPLDMGVRWLSSREARDMEPALADNVAGALFSPREGHVNSRRLVRALAQGAARRGATILQDNGVVGLLAREGRVAGVRLSSGEMEADWTVLASGAWAGRCGSWLGVDIPVHPVRGQILASRILPSPISRIVWNRINYLIPKADGSIVMGTTREEVDFADRPTLRGVASILRGAMRLVPAVGEAELHTAWAGLRPASPDGLPILGPVPGWEGVLLATGHYRSGILLSAVTGRLIRDYIAKGETQPLQPFSLSRFGGQ